ncbi:MAG TPA: helix-turn-helix domain-containing protein [Dehalococcoidia bacterium]|nr:helix-turn-helix domain-containing protein [Dehalococcoidia bacterium]
MPEQGWTIAQVARALEVSEKTVRRRIERGDLPAFRLPRGGGYEWRVDPAALGIALGAPAPGPLPIVGDDPTDATVKPLLDLLREKDQQILDLAHQLGATQERARLLEDELRQVGAAEADAGRRSWVRRLLR